MFVWCFFVVWCVTFQNVLSEDAEVCRAILGGQTGICVPLPSCPQYVELLKELTTTEEGLNITQMSRCGFDGLNVKVCCPYKSTVNNTLHKPTRTDSNDFVDEFPSSCGTTQIWRAYCKYPVAFLLNGKPAYKGISRWMALLGYNDDSRVWKCGGSIITQRHILTAGHCIKNSLYVVRLGEINLDEKERFISDPQPTDYLVKRSIRHENYSKFHNDIGLVVLEEQIMFTEHISPVCLPLPSYHRRNTELFEHGTVTGWGMTEKNEASLQLLYASVKLYDNDDCRQIYTGNITNTTVTIDERVLCAGEDKTDSCKGDSGGPLVWSYCVGPDEDEKPGYYIGEVLYFQAGIVSYGFKCEMSRFKGVYTNVEYFLPWIEEKVLGKRN
ncbi:hypothetical protein ABMA27_015981 [Loxostege sticticalis]|uniref:CLIP domain-containing serine protease n=1 Tax=Loxostege sticticalis TaxID=481309 RepID=A0ABR3I510_LOXSC